MSWKDKKDLWMPFANSQIIKEFFLSKSRGFVAIFFL